MNEKEVGLSTNNKKYIHSVQATINFSLMCLPFLAPH
jgi:hypothetical protein